MTEQLSDVNPALCDALLRRITESPQQRITFAEYMEFVLYHSQYGYYTTKAINIGQQGDFFTSPHLGADFGELLAEQFVQMWDILGHLPFTLLEMGAGQGFLAADILEYLERQYPDFFAVLDYVIVERSAALKHQQQQRLQKWDNRLRWCSLEEIPANSITGCCFSNELVDALPVHQFVIHQGQLQEIYVTTKDGINLEEVTGVSTLQLAEYFDLVGIKLPSSSYPEGYRSEVNLAALDWLKMVASGLQRGYLLTIDYGYPASRYYNPARSQGTLQCYYRHRHHNNPYLNIGRQDITAHVDFTALERWGAICGLDNLGFTQQGLFLMALGLGSRLTALSTDPMVAQGLAPLLRRREALHQLIDPMGLGGFGVLVQSKGLSETTQPLNGLIPSI